MPRIIGYRRISKEDARDRGLGLDAQQVAITSASARLALPLAETFTDNGLSGALPLEKRPALLAALAQLRRGDVLAVAKRDRLGRDVVNVALLERLVTRKGARVLSCAGEGTDDDGPTGALLRTLIDAFAQHERLVIAQRTRDALRVKRRRGERISGRLPFGYRLADDGVHLVRDDNEQRTLARLRALRAAGLSYQRVAEAANAERLRTRSGAPWCKVYVFNVLRKEKRARERAA